LPHRRRYVLHWRRRIGRGRHRFDPRRGGRHHRDRTRSHTRRRPDLGRGHGRPKEGRVLLMTTPPPTTEATAGFSPTRPKTLLRFATAGSVDDGKSTLVGRLLHDAKAILADQLAAVTATSAERGFLGGEFDFALLTDGLRAEREQGITIDVAYRYFATDRRSFTPAHCPGHVQSRRNMVPGATPADPVVVLIDARNRPTEQTRRHLTVISRLGIRHVIIAVNKIDLLDFDQTAIENVENEVTALADEIGLDTPHLIPISALAGDNIATVSDNTPWYE